MVSATLVILLVLALAMITYGMISGQFNPKYAQKSVYIAGKAQQATITQGGSPPYNLLVFQPMAGDPFYLTGQGKPTGTPTTMRILAPDGRNLTPDPSTLSSALYGKTLFIYPKTASNSCDFMVSDKAPANVNVLPAMVIGKYQIQIIDNRVNLLASTYAANITVGTTSLPVTTLMGLGTGTGYKADCSQYTGTCPSGCPSVANTSPCNQSYSTFSGSNYLSFANDPTLQYTGDMTIAVDIKPTSTGTDNGNTANWHQIIGKGEVYPNGTEIDNYQLFQIGNSLYFEWNDAVTGTHYHAETSAGTVTGAQWNQLDVTVSNGQLTIYNNGVSLPLTYYQSNIPTANMAQTPIAAPPVRLINTPNPVTIGEQNGGGNSGLNFNFVGDIGQISLYNRALSPTEIRNDLCPG